MIRTLARNAGLALCVLVAGSIILALLPVAILVFAVCALVDHRFAINMLLWCDISLNVMLLGAPYQTVSERTGWARTFAGQPWRGTACVVCGILTFVGRALGYAHDHCTAATTPGAPSGFTICRWSAQLPVIEIYEDEQGNVTRAMKWKQS